MERQNGWLKLPMGWVQENDVKKTEKEPITAEMLEKTYMGNFGKYEETGDTVYFGLQVIVPEENNGDAFVIVYLPDTRLFCMAKRHDDMIETTHGIMVKFAEYEADRTELAFQLYRERDGVKLFNLYYGERWNTRRIEKIIDETMTIDSFDTNKLTKDDWETLKKAIIKDGKPCQNYITAGMLKNLSPTDQF
ncbi:MAG: hypothetical protein IKT00_06075 [Prevotella sp.]|nr:hypothetical protein [Prevotella sp.]